MSDIRKQLESSISFLEHKLAREKDPIKRLRLKKELADAKTQAARS